MVRLAKLTHEKNSRLLCERHFAGLAHRAGAVEHEANVQRRPVGPKILRGRDGDQDIERGWLIRMDCRAKGSDFDLRDTHARSLGKWEQHGT